MRIRRLDLVAFGPFTDRHLDFGGGAEGGLHVVYGKNAAGKSSALRAVSDLLFGIPLKSGDDHVHPYPALRIRATLEASPGEAIVVQRLKRSKDSLRDENDAPLDEAVVNRLLGSMDRATFERVFGLNHERLRDAGRALLEGGGDVGESLFDAGAGGQGVRRVLSRLKEEAEQLFKPRGGKQEIALLLDKYKVARERVKNALHAPEAYLEQQRELELCGRGLEQISRELTLLREERERSRLLSTTLKGIAQRRKLLHDLGELGPLPELPPNFGEDRQRIFGILATERMNVERIERELGRLLERSSALSPPADLLAVGEDAMALLRERIGSTKKALADLPLREAALAEQRAEALVMQRRLGLDETLATTEFLQARRAEEARFRRLLADRGAEAERERAARERLATAEIDLETHRARLLACPSSPDAEGLERAVLLARHVGDVDASLAETRRELGELELLARAELGTLLPFTGTLAELCALRLPATETVARFEQALAGAEDRWRQAAADCQRHERRAAELWREISVAEEAGPVPSEAELERAREARDLGFDVLCQELVAGKTQGTAALEHPQVRGYRRAVAAADLLADRLRREASRVAESARRRAEHQETLTEQRRAQDLLAERERERAGLEQDWTSSWAGADLGVLRPGEVRVWLERRERAVQLASRQRSLREKEAALDAQARELRAALGELGRNAPLQVAVARAQERLDAQRRSSAERRALQDRIAELEVRAEAARRALQASERDRQQREAELGRAIQSLGFGSGLSPDQVELRLDTLADLLRVSEQANELARRIAGMRRDIEGFEHDVQGLVLAHARDLGSLPAWRAAAELVSRFDRARQDAAALARLHEEIAERQRELDEHQIRRAHAEAESRMLLGLARVTDASELPALELKTRRAREIRAQIEGLEANLTEAAGGRGLASLLEETGATDPVRLAARREELDAQIEELEERHADTIRSHQRLQAGLELFADAGAALAAEEERALAASLVVRAERWAKLKLAESLLAREIERYREENQGPVLRRAAELFARLTRGDYRTLRVGREERSLVAVRQTGLEVTVEGLNEAARYHLYLALRIASLERYLEHAEPLPLVLDDILIHFDEESARAALEVLEDLSSRVQVLLFTHHRHNVELCEAARARGRVFVHEL